MGPIRTGKEDGCVFGLASAGPRGRYGIPERPSCLQVSCKYVHLIRNFAASGSALVNPAALSATAGQCFRLSVGGAMFVFSEDGRLLEM